LTTNRVNIHMSLIMIERTVDARPRACTRFIIRNCLCKTGTKVPESQDARVHYAVPKQQPRRTPATGTRMRKHPFSCGPGRARDNRNNVHQDDPRRAARRPVASGPNSVPWTRRPRPAGPFQPASGRTRTGQAKPSGPRIRRHSTHEHPPDHTRVRNGHAEHPRTTTGGGPPGASCSLERR